MTLLQGQGQIQGGPESAINGGVLVHQELSPQKLGHMAHHGTILSHAASENDGLRHRLAGKKSVVDVGGEALTQALANRLHTVAFLLCVNEIRLREDRATSGDTRDLGRDAQGRGGQGCRVFQTQSLGLLIKKTARARGAKGIESTVFVLAMLVEDAQ